MKNNPAVPFRSGTTRRNRERGFTLVTMALASTALFGALGLSVDLGHLFITKNETQNFCDAAALAAALALDGTSTGISNAKTAVTNSGNKWNFSSTSISSPTVTFATTTAGPWSSAPSSPSTYIYTKVSVSVSVPLYFMHVVVPKSTQTVNSYAIAGQIPLTTFPQGLAPFTGVSTNTTGPYFGLTVGKVYDIQWPQYNSTRSGCGVNNPDKCFVQPTCADESKASEQAVVQYWGSALNGYWGSASNSSIEQEVLDLKQLQAVSVGTDLQPVLTNGNKASEAKYLDERASQDTNSTDNTVSAYLSNTHNGRRLIAVPIVDPSASASGSAQSIVVGYGQYLLYTNGSTSNYYEKITNGNDPFCGIYAGPYTIGSSGPGVTGSTGANQVKLVQ